MKTKKYAYMTETAAVVVAATSKDQAYQKMLTRNPNLKKSQVYRYN